MRSAYGHLNLRYNPFGSQADTVLSENAPAPWPLGEIASLVSHCAVQCVGPPGCGKSTRLRAIRSRVPHAAFVRLEPAQTTPFPDGSPLFIDEAQWLPRRWWIRIAIRRPALILGTQRDLRRWLRAADYVVETIYPTHDLDPLDLCRNFNARIEGARRAPGNLPIVREETVRRLRRRFGHDVRAMVDVLYDRIQMMRRIGDVRL